jgi:hypothetical protein
MQQSGSGDTKLERLFRLLEDWRVLTRVETDLIGASDWAGLEKAQTKKADLQQAIQEVEAAWLSTENLSDREKLAGKAHLRQIALELLELETRNRESLSVQLALTDQQLKDSSKTISSLRSVQTAYGRGGQSFWQAYS